MKKAKGKKLHLKKLNVTKLENLSSIQGGNEGPIKSQVHTRCPIFYKPIFTIITCPTNFGWG
ncbi:hypothetical protein [Aquimarina sp. Aq78]|uniref:hypothetical protein n=1 Tax=Aquimarina sp. Aq78 TaxID=1191889 RepID=UPI000D102227|nr:hypothetical protein [Aquimarina sp. Aq78]